MTVLKELFGIINENTKKEGYYKQKPRHKALHDQLILKKGGGHYSEKLDYKRAKEKQKFRKRLMTEIYVGGVTTGGKKHIHHLELKLDTDEIQAMIDALEKHADEKLEKLQHFLKNLYARTKKKKEDNASLSEAVQRFDLPVKGWFVASKKTGEIVSNRFDTKEDTQKHLMTPVFKNHQDFEVKYFEE